MKVFAIVKGPGLRWQLFSPNALHYIASMCGTKTYFLQKKSIVHKIQ